MINNCDLKLILADKIIMYGQLVSHTINIYDLKLVSADENKKL